MAREGSENFQNLVEYQDEYQPGARRYDVGEVANFVLLPGLLSSLGNRLALASRTDPRLLQGSHYRAHRGRTVEGLWN